MTEWGPAALPDDVAWPFSLVPALASAALVWLVVDAARQLGGTPAAQMLSGITVLVNAAYLQRSATSPMAVCDDLWWNLGLYGLLRVALDDRRAWLGLVGVAVAGAFTIGASPSDGAASLSIGWRLPWPLLAVLRTTWTPGAPMDFLRAQVAQGPLVVLAAVGAWRLLRDRAESGVRAIGIVSAVAFGAGFLLERASYATTPIYPLLVAAGASWWSQRCDRWFGPQGRHAVYGIVWLQLASTAFTLLRPSLTGSP